MNRNTTLWATGLVGALLVGAPAAARAQATVGQPAPAFNAPDQTGAQRSLDAYKGKWVVLEWVNHECPFVKKHYGSGNMQKTQAAAESKGAVWLSVNSSAPGKQGAMDGKLAASLTSQKNATPTAVLLDPDGKIGRAYGAKTTPHMFVIDPQGTVVYAGAIDDKPSTDQADVKTARNYVLAALDEAMAGKTVSTASTQPYGCSVKY
jgi:peroxiredoxin